MQNLQKAKDHFLHAIDTLKPNYKFFPQHIKEVENWAQWLINKHPNANKKVTLLSVYLHDIGHIIGNKEIDHAINSEIEANRFLKEIGVEQGIIEQVAHCVRSHRCKDVQPSTLEAKILAAADSASHMSDFCYIAMIEFTSKKFVLGKIERDYRDVGLFPELQQELTPVYNCWKSLIKTFPEITQV
jgi:hypothetical protein